MVNTLLVYYGAVSSVVLPYAKTSVDDEIPHHKHHLFYAALLLCITGLMDLHHGDAFNVFVFQDFLTIWLCSMPWVKPPIL